MTLKNLYIEVNRNPSPRELATFGATLLGMFAAFGLALFVAWDEHVAAIVLWAVGLLLCLVAVVPRLGRLLYVLWMCFGMTIGFVTTPIVLIVLYSLVFVPVALVMKVLRRDAMRRRFDRSASTYWEDWNEPSDVSLYIKQF